jgi:hypothetical protein
LIAAPNGSGVPKILKVFAKSFGRKTIEAIRVVEDRGMPSMYFCLGDSEFSVSGAEADAAAEAAAAEEAVTATPSKRQQRKEEAKRRRLG